MNKALIYGGISIAAAVVPAVVGALNINNEMVSMDVPAVYYDSLRFAALAVPVILSCFVEKLKWSDKEYQTMISMKEVAKKGAMVAGGAALISMGLGEHYAPVDGTYPGVLVNANVTMALFLSFLLSRKMQRVYENNNSPEMKS